VFGLAVWAATGAAPAIIAMAVGALLKFANPAIASAPVFGAALFWIVAMVAAARLYFRGGPLSAPFVLVAAFACVSLLLSIITSPAVDVSVMKLLSFYIVSSSVLLGSLSLANADVTRLQHFFFSVALVVVFLSVLTLPFPGVAFNRNGLGFQGVFNHPQAAGVFYVPFASWLIARVLLERWSFLPRWVLGLAVVFSVMIAASGARTAMFATFLSVALTLIIFLVKGRSSPENRTRAQIIGSTLVMVCLGLAILASGAFNEELESLVYKYDSEEASGDLSAAFEASRGAAVDMHIRNFLDAPLTGHGFGVHREGVGGGERNIVRVMGIPVSAPAEKGIVFTAVLEEVGVFGGLLFYALLISIIAVAAGGSSPGASAMVIGAIAVNFGEAIFFATGGMGLFMWAVIGFGLARARADRGKAACRAAD